MNDPTGTRETAQAVKAVAEATKSGIDAAREAGAFVGRLIGQPLSEVSGMATDWLKVKRQENLVVLVEAARARLRARGIENPTRLLHLTAAVPLLEAAALEDRPELQHKWANLLANWADADSGIEITRSYVDVLRVLTPLEVKILDVVYGASPRPIPRLGVLFETANLPNSANRLEPGKSEERPSPSDPRVVVALSNLSRVNCLSGGKTWDGGEHFGFITATHFGAAFVDACSDRMTVALQA